MPPPHLLPLRQRIKIRRWTSHRRIRGDIPVHNGQGADQDAVAEGDRADQDGAGVEAGVGADPGEADLAGGAAEGDVLVDVRARADRRGGAEDDAEWIRQEEAAVEAGRRGDHAAVKVAQEPRTRRREYGSDDPSNGFGPTRGRP
jgi:hypothetical protein